MLDITEQLRRYGDAVAETVDAVPPPEVAAVATQPSRRRTGWKPLLAIAAAVAVLAGSVLLATTFSDSSSPPAGTERGTPGVELLEPWPLAPRADTAVVWTGAELVVWGGDIEAQNMGLPGPDRAFGDGAAYNPATRQWRRMADGPLPTNMDGVSAVATDRGVVIARGSSVALWDPKTDTWRRLDDPPGAIEPGAVPDLEYSGTEVLSVTVNAALDLTTGRWRSLPAPPRTLGRPVAAWTGSELVVVGQLSFYTPGALAFDPARGTWRELFALTGLGEGGKAPALNPAAVAVDRDGDRLIFTDYAMHVVTYRRDGRVDVWAPLPSVPARFYEGSPTIASVPPAIIVTAPSAIVIRVSNGAWTPVPYDTLGFWQRAVVAPAGTARDRPSLLVFGMTDSGENRLALVDPARLAEAARTLQVGVVSVRLGPGVQLTRSNYEDTPGNEQVLVELSTPTGACTVTSTYDSGAGGGATPWTASADGRTWSSRPTSSDIADITCEDPSTAQELADATELPPADP